MGNDKPRKKDSARLVWDSKPRRAPNPRDIEFQTAEIVIPNPQRDSGQLPLSFRDGRLGEGELDKTKMNRLIWGDNLLAMQALLAHGYEERIDLIYIDPPFGSEEKYNYQTKVAIQDFGSLQKQVSVVERLAYLDTWAGGVDSYIDMIYPRLQLMKRLLSEKGNLFVHIDWRMVHYMKVLLDEVFGPERFVQDIIWQHQIMGGAHGRKFPKAHETILWYSRSPDYFFNEKDPLVRVEFSDYVKNSMQKDEEGRWFYTRRRMSRKATSEELARKAHTVTYVENPELGTLASDVWSDMLSYQPLPKDYTGFDTQKPSELLRRVVAAGSPKGGLVADFFSGSGTTAVIAESLGRRWVASELGKVGIQVARTRLVESDARPFLIENIGNYQREMIYLSGARIHEMMAVVLKLYGATPRKGTPELGTRKASDDVIELVYVGYPDRPTTAKKVEELARTAEKLDGTGYKRLVVLAWDYDYNFSTELEKRLKTSSQKLKVRIEPRTIPPEIYDYLRKAKEEEDIEPLRGKIRFYEKPYLKLGRAEIGKAKQGKAPVTIKIDRYVVFDIPVEKEEEREKLRQIAKDNFAVLIDYWAVDWDYDGQTFKSQWQDFRGHGRRTKVVTTQTEVELTAGKKYTVAVRVVDVFGNDAAGTVDVDLR